MSHESVRQLTDADRWRLRPHLKRLAPEDRRLRFGMILNDAAIDRYVDSLDFDREAVLAVAAADGALLAAAHVAPVGEGAELGLSVDARARRRGLGGALFVQAVAWARNRYLRRVHMHCLRENTAILRLARRHGMALDFDGAESSAVLLLPAPDVESWMREQSPHWHAAASDAWRMEAHWLDWMLAGPHLAAAAFAASLAEPRAGDPVRAGHP
ncbi:MAG: GNAT family N-acetyltransferase [Burkholderiales bacterium]|nr:GNAT family N-acetyltransferase [Burkholderiales bacterium]